MLNSQGGLDYMLYRGAKIDRLGRGPVAHLPATTKILEVLMSDICKHQLSQFNTKVLSILSAFGTFETTSIDRFGNFL